MNIVAEFSAYNTTAGVYNVTWTPPLPSNGSFYRILNYSYSSAYTEGPPYSDVLTSEALNQDTSYYLLDALYYTNYIFTLTTINIKHGIDNGPAQSSNQSFPAGTINVLTRLLYG